MEHKLRDMIFSGLDFTQLFDAAPSPYLIVAKDMRIVFANRAYLEATVTRQEAIAGQLIFDVFPDNPDDPDATGVTNLNASFQRVLRDKRPDTMAIQKYDIRVEGGDVIRFEERYWSPVNTPVVAQDGEVSYIIHCVEDVTDFVNTRDLSASMESRIKDQAIEIAIANRRLREANETLEQRVAQRTEAHRVTEEKLLQADRRKDEFLAMLAHELRNPLAPISAAAELLQLAKLDEEYVQRTSEIIARQVRHMTSLIDDLLDVSRVTRGLVELEITTVDINQIVAEAVEQVTPLLRERQQRLELSLAPDATLLQGDRKRLVQVLANLLNNAAKYTHEGGRLRVSTEVRDAQLLIEVSDNGIGMEPELIVRVFDLFSQAKRSSDRALGGLGLGLALVRSLVELHFGTVACESAGIGEGSKFTICLPRTDIDQKRDENVQFGGAGTSRTRSLRILVVDDNEDAATMLVMLLDASGHQVWVEHSGQAALIRAAEIEPEVCLLDIGLPQMDGNELARQLRQIPALHQTVLVATTGYGSEGDLQRTRAAGFNHHLVKPIDIKQLFSILDAASPLDPV